MKIEVIQFKRSLRFAYVCKQRPLYSALRHETLRRSRFHFASKLWPRFYWLEMGFCFFMNINLFACVFFKASLYKSLCNQFVLSELLQNDL